jgi:hypothetical protein
MGIQVDLAAGSGASRNSALTDMSAGLMLVTGVPYSARIDGKTYATNVQPVDDEYEGHVANLPGVSSVGATVEQVEDKLGNLISFFA